MRVLSLFFSVVDVNSARRNQVYKQSFDSTDKSYQYFLIMYNYASNSLIEKSILLVVSKEDKNRMAAEKKPQGYGPVVAEATSCSNDEVRKMHQTLVAVNANRYSFLSVYQCDYVLL